MSEPEPKPMKFCKACQEKVPTNRHQFCSPNCRQKDYRAKQKAYRDSLSSEEREKRLERNRPRLKELRLKRRERGMKIRNDLIERAGGGCQICGYNKCPSALHFHHRDPSIKSFIFSQANLANKSAEEIEEEFKKCSLLCANCHAEEHFFLRSLRSPSI